LHILIRGKWQNHSRRLRIGGAERQCGVFFSRPAAPFPCKEREHSLRLLSVPRPPPPRPTPPRPTSPHSTPPYPLAPVDPPLCGRGVGCVLGDYVVGGFVLGNDELGGCDGCDGSFFVGSLCVGSLCVGSLCVGGLCVGGLYVGSLFFRNFCVLEYLCWEAVC
jgi:hypothetical protein